MLPPAQFREVRYEGLQADTPAILRELSGFLSLAWSDAEIAAAIEANRPDVARKTGGGTPIPLRGEAAAHLGSELREPEGFIRKARAGSWKRDLTLWEKLAVWMVARRPMARAGYRWPFFLAA
jgi:hypothetical protein